MSQLEADHTLGSAVSFKEVEAAVSQMKNKKATGIDGVPGEVLKYGGVELLKWLHRLLGKVWDSERVPQDWKDAIVVSIYKNKGPRNDCNSYRGISLLSVVGKVLGRILVNRISDYVTNILPEAQCGFRKERSTTDMIFSLRQIQEKCVEQRKELITIFIDLTKAYDSVNREALWLVLQKFGFPAKIIRLIQSLHVGMNARVAMFGEISEEFSVTNGLRQGCVLAPSLFNIYFTAVLIEALHGLSSGIALRYKLDGRLFDVRRLKGKNTLKSLMQALMYADDCALVSHSTSDCQHLLDSFKRATDIFGLTISVQKTEVLYQSLSSPTNPAIQLGNNDLKVSESFTYLGSVISNTATLDKEITTRIQKAAKSFGTLKDRVWKDRNITLNTKLAVYKAIVLPTLLYGSQAWVTYQRHILKIESFHLRCLRCIAGVRWQDRITNTEVLKLTNSKSIRGLISSNRLKWLGHVSRMTEVRIPKQLLFGELVEGKRPQKKPKKRWKDCVRKDMKDFKIDESSWYESSLDRSLWRALVIEGLGVFEDSYLRNEERKRRNRKGKVTESHVETQSNPLASCPYPGCSRVFEGPRSNSSLKRHITMMHGNVPWRDTSVQKCVRCQRSFSRSGFARHVCKGRSAQK